MLSILLNLLLYQPYISVLLLDHLKIKVLKKWSLIETIIAFASNMVFHSIIEPYLLDLFGIEKVVNANNNFLKDGINGVNMILWIVVRTILAPFAE